MTHLPPSSSSHAKTLPDLISKLLASRQNLLVLFNQLVKQRAGAQYDTLQPLLNTFCNQLVDYMALGHFEVYQCLAEPTGIPNCPIQPLVRRLYPALTDTMQQAVAFSDRYAESNLSDFMQLFQDLSELGEQLAVRIDLEDQLIHAVKQHLVRHATAIHHPESVANHLAF